MIVIALLPFLVMLAGLIVFCVTTNAKVSAISLWCFGAGLIVTLAPYASRVVHLGG